MQGKPQKPVAENYKIVILSLYRNILILGDKIARVTRAFKLLQTRFD
jgi:hypothetical protein